MALPARGRPGKALILTVGRALTAGDLFRLETNPGPKTAPPMIQRLKASHHHAARLLASGRSVKEVAILTNRTPQRIGDLTRDPAFKNLMAYYETQVAEIEVGEAQISHRRLIEIADLADQEILERLEDDTERKKIPIGELRALGSYSNDRTLNPPKTAQPVINMPTKITFKMGTRDIEPKNVTPDRKVIEHDDPDEQIS